MGDAAPGAGRARARGAAACASTTRGRCSSRCAPRAWPATCLHLRGRADALRLRRALAEAGSHPGAVVTRGVSPQLAGEAIARRAGAAHVLNEHTPLTADGRLLAARPHQRLLTRVVAPRVDRVIAVSERQVDAARSARLPARADRRGAQRAVRIRRRAARQPRRHPPRARAGRAATSPSCAWPTCALRRASRPSPRRWRARAASCPGCAGWWPATGRSAAELARLEDVRLLGSRGDVPDLIAACDALCLLSEAEALPISVLEAMALGRPVVATDVGGIPEAVAHAQTGLIVAARATPPRRPGRSPAWRRSPSGRASWASGAARASASASAARRWSTGTRPCWREVATR